MSNTQSQAYIRKMYYILIIRFERYDSNKDGSINKREFQQLCVDMGYYLSQQEIEMDIQLLDSDGNGSIGFPEFINWWRTENRFKALQLSPEELSVLTTIRKDFEKYDKDHSGRIDIHEFKLLYQELVARKMTEKTLLQTLSEVDSNRDGKISFNEYVMWLLKHDKPLHQRK
jgi:calcium-binding protein CML